MPFPTGLRALNHRSFRHYWLGQLVSMVGRWMQAIGQSWLVLELTGSPLKLGIVNALQFAPILLLSFVAGAIADRVEKRQLLVVTQVGLRSRSQYERRYPNLWMAVTLPLRAPTSPHRAARRRCQPNTVRRHTRSTARVSLASNASW
jgi:MFS family permease